MRRQIYPCGVVMQVLKLRANAQLRRKGTQEIDQASVEITERVNKFDQRDRIKSWVLPEVLPAPAYRSPGKELLVAPELARSESHLRTAE